MGHSGQTGLGHSVTGLPVHAYKTLQNRLRCGPWFCELDFADRYRNVAYMLDEYGAVVPEYSKEYAKTVRAIKREASISVVSVLKSVLFSRLIDHLKKNRTRRGVVVAGKSVCTQDIDERCRHRFGFTLDALIKSTESKFQAGMTWDHVVNGDIQLDHEIPVRIFDLTTESGIKAAYGLDNTRPLWRSENAGKGNLKDKDWLELFGEGAIRG